MIAITQDHIVSVQGIDGVVSRSAVEGIGA